jgi:hypothetical protein
VLNELIHILYRKKIEQDAMELWLELYVRKLSALVKPVNVEKVV